MLTLASIFSVPSNVGYPALVALILAESAGVPVPGETSLITGAILAASHKLSIELVIILAAASAIVGDNIGYLIGRKGGRYLLERPGPFRRQRAQVLRTGEPFFEKHGPKAVFFGRWILGLRTWAAWLAGATDMPWRKFVFWNALGGIGWAITIGLLGYFLGQSVKAAISSFGLYALIAVGVIAAVGLLLHHRHRRRAAASPESERPPEAATTPD